jgi:hypothetical protein
LGLVRLGLREFDRVGFDLLVFDFGTATSLSLQEMIRRRVRIENGYQCGKAFDRKGREGATPTRSMQKLDRVDWAALPPL